MSKTQTIIQEIDEIRQRRGSGNAMSELPSKLFGLEACFKKLDRSNLELIRYFPVALIACIEGYYRLAITEIVDAGEPYLGNAEKSAGSMKFDFNLLRAIHGKKISVGELIAHSVPISRLDHIETVLSNLLGKSYLSELRLTTDRWAREIRGEPATPILNDPDKVFADVARTFELRHIICHELASAFTIEIAEIENCFESCVAFLKASDECISEILYPGAPLCQTDMNQLTADQYNDSFVQLNETLADIRECVDPERLGAFNDVQSKWQTYRDDWAKFEGDQYEGGTITPVIYFSALKNLTEQRNAELIAFKKSLII